MELARALLWALILAVGVTQPGGAATTIFIYDNASAANASYYTFAEISTAFPADFIDNGTTPKSYRSKVSLQVGDTGVGAAATTLQDTDVAVFFDAAKVLQYRSTQTTSWTTNLGTKVGTGNKATGRNGCLIYQGTTATFRGNWAAYGSSILSQGGTMTFSPATSGSNYELVDCIIGNKGTGGTSTISIGSASVAASNIYNVDLWGNISSASLGLITALNSSNAERISIGINAAGYFIRSSQSTFAIKDLLLFGTPLVADIAYTGGAGSTWTLVNIGWSGNAPKFANMSASAGDITEYRVGDVKAGDGNGTNSSGVAAKLTDTLGNVIFNTTTDSAGRVAFGSGLTTNAVPVLDHYGAVSYLTRARSPFLMAAGALRYYFNWPTDVNGNFEDMVDAIPLAYAGGGPTSWNERFLP